MHEKRFGGENSLQSDIDRLRSPQRVERLEIERVVSLCLEGLEAQNVLDVGVGSGLFAEEFYRRGLAVAGIDVNPAMIAAARQYVPAGIFREGMAEQLPEADASYDLVFFGLVLHESDEPLKVLQEAHRVARQRVCILEWPYQEEEVGPPLAHRLNPVDIAQWVDQAGYTCLEKMTLNQLNLYRLTI